MNPDTTTIDLPRHGGDLAYARARYGGWNGGWLDLSTGINPRPYQPAALGSEDFAQLPDRGRLGRLIETARAAYGVPAGVPVAAVPGTEIAVRLLPSVAPPGKAVIVGPTYPSHADAWAVAGRRATEVAGFGAIPPDAGIVILGNPNNPDGRILAPDTLAALARRLASSNGLLIVDEAFADVAPEASLAPRLGEAPAIVLRSFGKFFGLAGLRLGFVTGANETVARLAEHLGDWPVSGPAIAIGTAALADSAWQEKARDRLKRTAAALRELLVSHGVGIVGGTDLFVLAMHPRADRVHDGLARRGIWTRAFASRRDWLRFGLPPDKPAFQRLGVALGEVMATATTE